MPLDENEVRSSHTAGGNSPFLGLGVLASILGFSVLFTTGEDSAFGYKLGAAAGQLFASAVIALPILLIWRYASKFGQNQSIAAAFNTYAFICSISWFIFFGVAKSILPHSIDVARPAPSELPSTDSKNPFLLAPKADGRSIYSQVSRGELFGVQLGDTVPIEAIEKANASEKLVWRDSTPPPRSDIKVARYAAATDTGRISMISGGTELLAEAEVDRILDAHSSQLWQMKELQECQALPPLPVTHSRFVCGGRFQVQLAKVQHFEHRTHWFGVVQLMLHR